jgi:hypothetical protein
MGDETTSPGHLRLRRCLALRCAGSIRLRINNEEESWRRRACCRWVTHIGGWVGGFTDEGHCTRAAGHADGLAIAILVCRPLPYGTTPIPQMRFLAGKPSSRTMTRQAQARRKLQKHRVGNLALYSSKIIKAGAMLADSRTLEIPAQLNLDRIRRENVLGKVSPSLGRCNSTATRHCERGAPFQNRFVCVPPRCHCLTLQLLFDVFF